MSSTRTLDPQVVVAPALADAGAARPSEAGRLFSGLHAFFRHHGALAPAVRLLRRLSLQGKVAVVGSGFVAAAVLLGAAYGQRVLEEDRASRAALDGASQLRALTPLQQGVWTAGAGRPSKGLAAQIPAASQALADLRHRLPVDLSAAEADPLSAAAWKRLESAWTAAAVASAPVSAWVELSEAINGYRGQIVSSSGLLRTADAQTYRLGVLLAGSLPELAQRLASAAAWDAPDPSFPGALQTDDHVREIVHARVAFERLRLELARLSGDGLTLEAQPAVVAALKRIESAFQAAPGGGPAFARQAQAALVEITALDNALASALEAGLRHRLAEGRRDLAAVAIAVTALLGVGFYLLIGFHRVMAGGLRSLSDEVKRMAEGDLSARPTPRGDDEVAEALQSLGGSLAMLSDMFATVRQGVAAVAQASDAIARGNGDLAERTSATTRQLQQVVNSVNLYMEQLDQSARRVDDAAAMVEMMRLEAARSRSNMGQLQGRMQLLQDRSREIAAIVEAIDGIAFRTNVLALNASIEAAKAGDAGRGFAVVAQEVRRLARRSAESARSIQEIVGRSTEDILQGAALADRTGAALQATDQHVARVHESMQQIVQLTRGGEANSRTILQSIHELDRLTGENGVLVDQIAAASMALSGNGNELATRVAGFKLG